MNNLNLSDKPYVSYLQLSFRRNAKVFSRSIDNQYHKFGDSWLIEFESTLSSYCGADFSVIDRAVVAYNSFCLESIRLQAEFDKTLEYRAKSYEDVVNEVYCNDEYMDGYYLPALFLTHFMWPHHYRLKQWVQDRFLPELALAEIQNFCDIGIGTGFYSWFLLQNNKNIEGYGFDISESSIKHTTDLLNKHDLVKYHFVNDVISPKYGLFDSFVTVELLEHLDDPQLFLSQLRQSVKLGSVGLITAALDAPNRDHIYLYRTMEQVEAQIKVAGFSVVDSILLEAYEAHSSLSVPKSACFIVKSI